MIFVERFSDTEFGVMFKPVADNLERIRSLRGAYFSGEKAWVVPMGELLTFEEKFKGEFIYVTPRHELLGYGTPPLPKMYDKIPRHDVPRIKPPYTLYNYQNFGANYLACIAGGTGHAILSDSVGTGKTIQSIAGAHILQEQGKADTVLVFCKASLKYQWLSDGIQKFTSDEGIVIDGSRKQRDKQYAEAQDPKYRYVILNYELLLHDLDQLMELVEAKGIKLAICDEAHKITNPKGKMNNALAKLVQAKKKYPGIDYIFYLTATPLSSKVEQMYGIFSIRRPDFFGKFSQFAKRYLKYRPAGPGRAAELVGYLHMDEIREKTWKFMLRRTNKEVEMELPEKVEIFREVPFTPLQKKLDALAKADMDHVEQRIQGAEDQGLPQEAIEALEGAAKAMFYVRKAIADDPQLLLMSKSDNIRKRFGKEIQESPHREKSPKWDELKEIIEESVMHGGEKMVLFTELETMTRLLLEKIQQLGIEAVVYTGKMSSKEKHEAAMRFREHPDCKILIATDAGAEGLNLQVAPLLVNYDLPWLSDVYTQRNGRIQRGGSSFKTVRIINLMAKDGIDPAVWEAIQNKQKMFNFFVENSKQQSEALIESMKR